MPKKSRHAGKGALKGMAIGGVAGAAAGGAVAGGLGAAFGGAIGATHGAIAGHAHALKHPKGPPADAYSGAVRLQEGEEALRGKRKAYIGEMEKMLTPGWTPHAAVHFAREQADIQGLGDSAQRKEAIRKGRLKRR